MSTAKPPKTRRAEPLQPDRPGRGTDAEPQTDSDEAHRRHEEDEAARLRKQSETALDNVREGYGKA